MADIVLSPLLQVVFDRVASHMLKSIAQRCGFGDEVDGLRRTFRVIQGVLEDAERRQLSDTTLKLWLSELKDLAYDTDDLLDELAIFSALPRSFSIGFKAPGPAASAHSISSYLRPYAAYLKLFPKLKLIRRNLDSLSDEMSRFNLKEMCVVAGNERVAVTDHKRKTGSFVIESEVFGRDADKEKIVELITSSTNENMGDGALRNVAVIPIVGLGGLGKTTLAQLAYNDDSVTGTFDLKLWVSVNEFFDLESIMRMIIEAASRKRCKLVGFDGLQHQVRGLLRMRKCLLVLDDVWNEDQDEWDKFRMLICDCAAGSKVLVTTRIEKVASIVGTISPYFLKGLSHEHCWILFKQRAFASREECLALLPIGQEVVKKCEGVPLAAKTLGSLMRFKREEAEWLYVKESELWNVWGGENGILPALRLSYLHLPPHLKRCFMYCSIFPKNYVINKDKLIQMWIAEGLIRLCDERKSVEDIGNEYFNDLVWMFFFEDVKKSSDGNATECRMHNLIHDLAQSIAGNEFVILEHGSLPSDLTQTRHASVVSDFGVHGIPEMLYDAGKLRTLNLLLAKGDLGEVPNYWFSRFRYLRVLNLTGSGIKRLHESVSSLISLRYLDLSHTFLEMLPDTICDLSNLKVLNLSCCHDLLELPSRLSNLFSLSHLMINGCQRLSYLPDNIALLGQLRTLPMFIVGSSSGKCLAQLGGLRLEGELNIKNLHLVPRSGGSRANLSGKPKLHSLGLSWGDAQRNSTAQNGSFVELAEGVIESLQPHKNLQTLSIEGYPGACFPRWVGTLPMLTKIVLVNCKSCEHVPQLGQLPLLQIIHMQGMHTVKKIGSEFYNLDSMSSFKSLLELTIIDFPNLEYWWSSNAGEEFPLLRKLTISKCPMLKNMPDILHLQQLELKNCNKIILRSIAHMSSLSILVIDDFKEHLPLLGNLLDSNPDLEYLKISSCPKLCSTSLKIGGLTCLKTLIIRWCAELFSLPEELENLSSLESLEISECHNLTTLPENIENLGALNSLSIENCHCISSLPTTLQHLSALEHLTVMFCPNLASLPNELANLSKLKSLYILNCPKLSHLPESLKHVTSLETLEIHSCPSLKSLPEWIQNLGYLRSLVISDCHKLELLPDGFQLLSNLQHLSIRDCSALEERCRKSKGRDWPKIAHIPHTYVGRTR